MIITKAGLEKILNILEIMVVLEENLSEFYKACAAAVKEDEDFWLGLAEAERGHGENIKEMIQILAKKKERFTLGRPFNLAALETVTAGVGTAKEKVVQGKLSREKMYFLARDFEQSVIESRYHEIVKSGDLEYLSLVKYIVTQTQEHKRAIEEKIADLQAEKEASPR